MIAVENRQPAAGNIEDSLSVGRGGDGGVSGVSGEGGRVERAVGGVGEFAAGEGEGVGAGDGVGKGKRKPIQLTYVNSRFRGSRGWSNKKCLVKPAATAAAYSCHSSFLLESARSQIALITKCRTRSKLCQIAALKP